MWSCDNKWSAGQQYRRKELGVIIRANEEEEMEEIILEGSIEETQGELSIIVQLEISLNSVLVITTLVV